MAMNDLPDSSRFFPNLPDSWLWRVTPEHTRYAPSEPIIPARVLEAVRIGWIRKAEPSGSWVWVGPKTMGLLAEICGAPGSPPPPLKK